ncbi:MAG: biotin/lipoyl-binding protein, partial [Pseudomonadota bacterium]
MSGIDLHRANFKTLNAIKTPKIMRVVAVLLLASVVAAIGFLTYTPWVQTTSGAGSVTALDPEDRQQTVNAFVSGRIEEWFVREGSMVRRGEPIAKIVDNDPQLLDRLEAERAQVVAQLEAVQRGLATARIDLDRM